MEIEERFVDWRWRRFGRLIHIARRDGRRARLLRPEHHGRRRRRRTPSRCVAAPAWSGFAAMAPQRVDLADRIEDPRAARGRGGPRDGALREARQRRSCTAPAAALDRTRWRPSSATRPSARCHGAARPGLRDRLQHDPPNRDGVEHVADVLVASASSTATTSSSCSTRPTCASPTSTCSRRPRGRRSDPAPLARRAGPSRTPREQAPARRACGRRARRGPRARPGRRLTPAT